MDLMHYATQNQVKYVERSHKQIVENEKQVARDHLFLFPTTAYIILVEYLEHRSQDDEHVTAAVEYEPG